ncbi:MAG: hypothetical protein JRI32_08550 [Deltaproteobacteria bacterium]|nr:hypothetical protein [Deltaproteobacteria bacterium]
MSIKEYPEKEIRNKILSKIKPVVRKGRSKHDKGYIYVDGKLETKVKIPNNHGKIMKESKSRYIAAALKLNDDEFNNLIDCPLTGPQYYDCLKSRIA